MQNGSTVLVPICHYFEEKSFLNVIYLDSQKKFRLLYETKQQREIS